MNTSIPHAADEYIVAQDDEARSGSSLEQLDLQHYLRILRKYKWPIVLFTAVCTGLAAYYAYTATPIYSATSTLLIEQQKANIVNFEELYDVDAGNTDYYQTQYELLQSRSLAQKVIETLGLWDHPELSGNPAALADPDAASAPAGDGGLLERVSGLLDRGGATPDAAVGSSTAASSADDAGADAAGSGSFAGGDATTFEDAADAAAFGTVEEGLSDDGRAVLDADREAAISRFLGRLTIAPVRKTKLVKISYESADPELAVKVANAVGEGYITSYLESKLELTERASSWLGERLASLKETLDESEQRLVEFKQANGLVDVDGSVGRLNEQELLLSTAELAQARSDLSGSADLYREVQALRDRPELLTSISAIQADPIVQRVKIEQGQAQRNLDELRNRYGDRHPRVVDAQSALATLDVTMNQTLNRVVASIEKNYQLTQQRVRSIENQLAQGKQDIQAIGGKKFELDSLEREVATNRNIYDEFFSRMSQAKSADGLETANARVSDYAIQPTVPVKPKKQLIIALAALASLVLSSLMALLYEQMDETVKSTTDVERKLGQQLLGILPLVKSGLFGRKSDLPLNPTEIEDERNTFHEAVNTARTAITVGQKEGEGKVIMITSSVPGEGKSTASINLAYSLARMERVLLIDCDMRRPTIAKSIGRDRQRARAQQPDHAQGAGKRVHRARRLRRLARRHAGRSRLRAPARAALLAALQGHHREPRQLLRPHRHRLRADPGGLRRLRHRPALPDRGLRGQVARHLDQRGAFGHPAPRAVGREDHRRADDPGGRRQARLLRRRLLLPGLLRLLRLHRQRHPQGLLAEDQADAGGAAGAAQRPHRGAAQPRRLRRGALGAQPGGIRCRHPHRRADRRADRRAGGRAGRPERAFGPTLRARRSRDPVACLAPAAPAGAPASAPVAASAAGACARTAMPDGTACR